LPVAPAHQAHHHRPAAAAVRPDRHSQIVQYYYGYHQTVGASLDAAVHDRSQRLLTERQVNVRLTELIEELRKKGNFEVLL
jgi:hypothetical protein